MSTSDSMITLQERMVNLVNQLSMPVIETSLVIGKWTNRVKMTLEEVAKGNNETLPLLLSEPWPLDVEAVQSSVEFELDKALSAVDVDRMDILETLIRVSIEELQMPLSDTLLVLRTWEKLVREQLSQASGPGQLFSPTEFPDDF